MKFPALRYALAATALIGLAGCKTYKPAPFDAAAFDRQWLSRQVDGDSVREFAKRLSAESGAAGTFDLSDGLSLAEAQAVALIYNADLRTARLQGNVARARADHAGRWADPVLGVDAEQIIEDVDEPWVVSGTIQLTIPLSGRLDAERQHASAEHAVELTRIAGQEWELRQRLRQEWTAWSLQTTRIQAMRELTERLSGIAGITKRLSDAGTMTRIEAGLFQLELSTRQLDLIAAEADEVEQRLRLLALMGLAPNAEVRLVPDTSKLLAPSGSRRLTSNAAVQVATAEYDVAEQALRREIRKQYPDLVIGPGFGTDEGDERVLLGLSLPLPLWNRNQQGVAEATAGRDVARAKWESVIETQASAVATAQARADAARRQRELLETTIVPAADAHAADARRVAELGDVNAAVLLDTLTRQFDVKNKVIDAHAAESRAILSLYTLLGPGHQPATTQPTTNRGQ